MRHFTAKLFVVTISALPLFASSVTVDWNKICSKAGDHRITATTLAGNTISGHCQGVSETELSVRSAHQTVVRIARDNLARVLVHREKGYGIRSVLSETAEGLLWGVGCLASPYFPLGIVLIPASLVWGAVRLPVYAVDDLVKIDAAPTEIYSQ